MRAVELHAFGLDNLAVTERPDPRPGFGQVLLRMRAVSLNYRDLLTVQGKYNPKLKLPLIPCSDGVGEVVELGEGVTRVQAGDRVCPIFAQQWLAGEPTREKARSTLGGPLDGTMAELMAVDQEGLVKVPDHLTDVEAASLPCAAVTAWNALMAAGVKAGDTVLVQGTGGVSLFALQFAKALGARVIATSSSDQKLVRVREMGAAEGINYRETPEWGARARELTGGVGVDLVVEVGGAGTLDQSLRAVRFGGAISLIGNLAGIDAQVRLTLIFMQHIRMLGIFVGHRESFEAMNRAIAVHGLRPAVDQVFALEESRAAFELMEAGGHFGKICVRVP
ncbi:MAG TPA: NAD(P)-dependent alcohol dehydrogenase [Thermoanaerobaculia bacterium]|jgi:NADPH:quinone reductase-like Zn-dependent oxidoreductase|nr:NAD(P)-dependent alcohol dehydrogenase [Thermoanaerobaculia bacterium]